MIHSQRHLYTTISRCIVSLSAAKLQARVKFFIATLGPFNRDGKVIEILAECCHQEEDADQLCKVVIENKLG